MTLAWELKNKKMTETINERVATLEQCQKTMADDISDIKNILLGRPSWIVSFIITLLSTVCCSLGVFILNS